MKYLATLLFALAFLCAPDAQAGELKRIGTLIKSPMVIAGGTSERMSVTFTHDSHMGKGFGCATCHHEKSLGSAFVSCRDESCHATPGARERDTMSMFMAFHSTDTDRSCYGCHTKLAYEEPDKYGDKFQNCRPCHISPQAKAAAAAK